MLLPLVSFSLLLLLLPPGAQSFRVGEFATLVPIEGSYPGVAYFDRFFGRIRWVVGNNTAGTVWEPPVFSGKRKNIGLYLDADIVDGHPAVSCFNVGGTAEEDPLEGALFYNRARDPRGVSGWTDPQLVDKSGNVGQFTSLEVVNGNPAISYLDNTIHFGGLKYVRALDPRGDAWGAPVFVDKRSLVGLYTQLEVLGNGNPAIAYYSLADGDLRFAAANDVNGASWGRPIVLDERTEDIGTHASMAVGRDGIPCIAYYDNINHNLWFIRARDNGGSTWFPSVLIDGQRYTGRFVSLTHLSNGNPALAYFANEVHELRFKKSNTVAGADGDWDAYPTYIDPPDPRIQTNFLTHAISLRVISGVPMIAYYEQVAADLKSAVSVSPIGANGSWIVNAPMDRGAPPTNASPALAASFALLVVIAMFVF